MWKQIEEFPSYSISDTGLIRRIGTGELMKQHITKDGYFRVKLSQNARRKMAYVHRLVASAYIPNPDGKPQINHINGVKTDNRVENLEWCTIGENQTHSRRILGKQNGFKSRSVVCCENGKRYCTIMDAAKDAGTDVSSIVKCAKNIRKTAGGYHWSYAEEGLS